MRMAATLLRWPLLTHHPQLLIMARHPFTSNAAGLPINVAVVTQSPTPGGPTPKELRDESDRCYRRLDLTFENAQEAFKSKSNLDLMRAMFVFRCCQIDFLVQHNQRILQTMRKLLGKTLFKKVQQHTFYGHFVAGDTLNEVSHVVAELQRFGLKSILDYSVEKDISQEEAQEKAVESIKDEKQTEIQPAIDQGLNSLAGGNQQSDEGDYHNTRKQFTPHKEFGDRRKQVFSARTYFYSGESECDRNTEVFCKCIDSTSEATQGQGFTAIKLTALGRPLLLMRLTEAIAQVENLFKVLTGSSWENLVLSRITEDQMLDRLQEFGIKTDSAAVRDWFKQVDINEDGFVDFFDWGLLLDVEASKLTNLFQVLNVKTGKLEPVLKNLTEHEARECANMMGRLMKINDHAVKRGVRIMIDAEQTYFQPAISRLAVALMRRYNRERGQVLNTYQAYLKNGLANLRSDLQLARRENFHFSCKVVRGAYMEQERLRAAAIGYDDPIHPSHGATSLMYHRCLDAIVEEWASRGRGAVSVMVATHNKASVQYAVELMKMHGIAPSERVLCFGQLYGMCDYVSFTLGQAGYSVYKYIPYGPVEEVLPYLSRRALENGAMVKNVSRERRLLWKELRRRIGAGQLLYRVPQGPQVCVEPLSASAQ